MKKKAVPAGSHVGPAGTVFWINLKDRFRVFKHLQSGRGYQPQLRKE